jgi:protein-tyrosine phosphatase
VAVLERFHADGVREVVCTPHLDASRATSAPVDAHRSLLAALQAAVPSIRLRSGWEILLDLPGADLSHDGLTLGDSRALLVEFSRGGIPRGALQELRRLVRAGRVPLLAHPERYYGCTVALVREFRAIGVVIQTDVSVLLGRGAPSEMARDLLAAGCIDILASDNHGDRRSLAAGHQWLEAQGASAEQVTLLTEENAARLLRDEPVLTVPSLATGGALAKLRRRFGR